MADRLSLYNGALRRIGQRKLANLSENVESRRQLDTAWDDNAVKGCLEAGLWMFAIRSMALTYSPSLDSQFGYRYIFTKPEDWCRTALLCSDEYMQVPLLQYRDEAGFWRADLETIYVGYVSDDPAFGGDMSLWPKAFADFVECTLACGVVLPLTQSEQKKDKADREVMAQLKMAQALVAQAQPTKLFPSGSWTSARMRNSMGNGWSRR